MSDFRGTPLYARLHSAARTAKQQLVVTSDEFISICGSNMRGCEYIEGRDYRAGYRFRDYDVVGGWAIDVFLVPPKTECPTCLRPWAEAAVPPGAHCNGPVCSARSEGCECKCGCWICSP